MRLIAALFAAGGAVHGYALGESIIGAEATPLAAYLIGLVAVQTALTTGIALAARSLTKGSLAAPSLQLRLAGLAVAVDRRRGPRPARLRLSGSAHER